MKKILSFITIVTFAVLLVACGGDRAGGPAGKLVEWYELADDADYDGSAVTIKFWHRMGDANSAMIGKWIEEFNEIYPNITVDDFKAANDYDSLANTIALNITTGNYPDIAESYPDHIARYAQSDALLALNNFIDHPIIGLTEEQQNDFLPGLWAEGVSYDDEGTRLSMPFSKSTEAFFYNATYFEQHDYEVPTTWDEVFEIAEDIKSREPNSIPFGYDSSDNFFITASEQWQAPYTGYDENGRPEVQFNNDTSKEMIKYFKDKVDRGLLLTRALNGDAFTSDIFKQGPNAPEGKTLYMYVGSTGGTRYAYEGMSPAVFNAGMRVGVAPVPAKDANHRRQIQQGPNINLFQHGDEQRAIAAWLFAKFITQPEKSAEYAIPSGYAPTSLSAYETELWTNHVNQNVVDNPTTLVQATDKLVVEAINLFSTNGDAFFTSTVFNLSSKTRGEVGALLNLIFEYDGNDLDGYIDQQYTSSYNFLVN